MGSRAVLLLVLTLLVLPSLAFESDGATSDIRLSAVYPISSFEGFAITNYGRTVDLKGYDVWDGEGAVTFTATLKIAEGGTIYFFKDNPPAWFDVPVRYVFGTSGIVAKGFSLADSGDDLYLRYDGRIIDCFAYGNVDPDDSAWKGDPFRRIPKGHIASRFSAYDTDSALDWKTDVIGRTHFTDSPEFEAKVVPFFFPDEECDAILAALQDAKASVDISVYLLNHPIIVSLLIELLGEGVGVRILFECSPAGGAKSSEIQALRTLYSSGAEIRGMCQIDGYRRYPYLHSKYAVVDGHTTIITSENWQSESFSNNRGWGSIIVSRGFAEYMGRVFECDFKGADTVDFKGLYPTSTCGTFPIYRSKVFDMDFKNAIVRPVISPDNSASLMKELISGSSERVYSEQLSVEYGWLAGTDNPIVWMKNVDTGVECRLIIDSSFDDRNDGEFKDSYGVIDALEGTNVSARSSSFDGMTHNKGLIVDDSVWIGSVNWTDNSLYSNRECAVIIRSAEVADYFALLFDGDWGETTGNGTAVRFEIVDGGSGAILLDASGSVTSEDAIFSWDIDGDGITDRVGRKILVSLQEGKYDITLVVTDGSGIHSVTTTVMVSNDGNKSMVPLKYYPIILICVATLLFGIIRKRGGKNGPDKGIQADRPGSRL